MKTARQLFLDEEPDVAEMKGTGNLTVYKEYLGDLLPQHIRSITLAENAYKNLITGDKNQNDKLFRLFREFYASVISENQDYYMDGGKETSGDIFTSYGLRINVSECGDFIAEDPEYLPAHFSAALSDGLKEFLLIRKKHYDQSPATYLIEDAALSITWDHLSDWVIDWEEYIDKYPDCEEAKDAESDLRSFLDLYLLDFHLDNTPMFNNGILSKELQKSYSRFLELYQDSRYYSLVKGYYEILKKNGFRLNEEAKSFLAGHGIKSVLDSPAEAASFIPNMDNIKDIMNIEKEQVLEKLGPDYKIVDAGAEGQEEGYYYEKYGMTIVFNDLLSRSMIELIECDEKADINGAKLGMSFKEICKVLGEGETRELVKIEPGQPNFALYYAVDNFIVWFGASEKDGAASDLQIRRSQ
jgi:hypothetical protein